MPRLLIFIIVLSVLISCKTKQYATNGETIYRTGKNQQGLRLLDKQHSEITFIKSCQACHGPDGKRNRKSSITFACLSDPKTHLVPYTDSLFFRFLDADLKSDGSPVQTGVKWNMSLQDKQDLLAFLKTL